ncbi:MAG TPA: TonB-dependent receptor [Candidatus Sulfotelmatobacter sp.]|nr:TonB-dependent receptor [Candidatus Sulfotelmatobacter sp.]
MAYPNRVKRALLALLVGVSFVLQGTASVLAGTTGTISGTVQDPVTKSAIAGARVTAVSPSQSSTTTTDAGGRFVFLSLAPDTYAVSVEATSSRDQVVQSGITVQADQTISLTLGQPLKLKTIGSVTSRSSTALVKPGTTADVYSINSTLQDKASGVNGGGTLNSAWSAISTVPGVFVAPNQNGYIGAGASLSIRGGDYDQIGYEFDGVPINRSFDNYPSTSLSSLGQQEVQVYTGAPPANSEGDSLSGYINQVIRTGTAPPYKSLDLAIGTPTLYNRLAFETGGVNPSRTFSYYGGIGGYDQTFRYVDPFNGAGLSQNYGPELAPCQAPGSAGYFYAATCNGPGGADYTNGGTTPAYVLGPFNGYAQKEQLQRDAVLNFHFGIPQKDGNKDDVQVLYDNSHLLSTFYDAPDDLGGTNYLTDIGIPPVFIDAQQMLIPYGTVLPQTYTGGGASQYLFPSSPQGRDEFSNIPPNESDTLDNDQSIVKVQYQHNFGTSAFLRVYGYTYYSHWFENGPDTTYDDYLGVASPDYELSSHTRGLSLEFSDQLNSQHLLTVQGNYTTATSVRDNNSFYANQPGTYAGYMVNGSNPYNGTCYGAGGVAYVGCNFGAGNVVGGVPAFNAFTIGDAEGGTVTPATGTCGTGPCQYVVVAGGPTATYNTVVPKFSAFSITDTWTPTSRLNINLGLRYDDFTFDLPSTLGSGARTLFYNAFNESYCVTTPGNQLVQRAVAGGACPAGSVPANFTASAASTASYNELQPRIGATYTLDPLTVLRVSYGRYAQAPNTAFEQYNFLQPDAPNSLYNVYGFNTLGFDTPDHPVQPEVSNNIDGSIEHQFGSTGWSLKFSPFYRSTQNQIQDFFLNQKQGFVSGLNVGHQTSDGIELEIDKGDFARNGWAGRLSFTYTNSYIQYGELPNGAGTILSQLNANIKNYNIYTSFCQANPTSPKCAGGLTDGGAGTSVAYPCYLAGVGVAAGAGGACPTGSVANPYWNSPVQSLINDNADFPTFDIFPGGIGSSYDAYGAPYVATLMVQYKHNRLALTPAMQFVGGERYGAPLTESGVAPDTCTGALPGTTRYDVTTCGSTFTVPIPDTYTGVFDGIGSYVNPNYVSLNLQASYDVSPRVTLVGTFANIYTHCFGGSSVPWAVAGACGYGVVGGGAIQPIGNNYNPGDVIQPLLKYPYAPSFGGFPLTGFPFTMYFEARVKV